jgi:hypothetical protein
MPLITLDGTRQRPGSSKRQQCGVEPMIRTHKAMPNSISLCVALCAGIASHFGCTYSMDTVGDDCELPLAKGEDKVYYERETYQWYGRFVNGQKEGIWELRSEDGRMVIIGTYLRDKEHGVWLERFPDGMPRSLACYRMGVMHGPWLQWKEDGSIITVGTNADGKGVGKWLWWINGEKRIHDHGALDYPRTEEKQ